MKEAIGNSDTSDFEKENYIKILRSAETLFRKKITLQEILVIHHNLYQNLQQKRGKERLIMPLLEEGFGGFFL